MNCPTCGTTLEPTATSCPACGAPVPGGSSASSGGNPQPAGVPRYGTPPPSGSAGHVPPHPSGLSSETRNWAMAAHLSAFLGAWLLLAFMGPLVVWLVKREDHPFIDHHGKEALNFNLSFLIYGVVGAIIAVPLALLTIGLGLIPLGIAAVGLIIAWVVLPIVGAVNAANGDGYRYPLTIRFVR